MDVIDVQSFGNGDSRQPWFARWARRPPATRIFSNPKDDRSPPPLPFPGIYANLSATLASPPPSLGMRARQRTLLSVFIDLPTDSGNGPPGRRSPPFVTKRRGGDLNSRGLSTTA